MAKIEVTDADRFVWSPWCWSSKSGRCPKTCRAMISFHDHNWAHPPCFGARLSPAAAASPCTRALELSPAPTSLPCAAGEDTRAPGQDRDAPDRNSVSRQIDRRTWCSRRIGARTACPRDPAVPASAPCPSFQGTRGQAVRAPHVSRCCASEGRRFPLIADGIGRGRRAHYIVPHPKTN